MYREHVGEAFPLSESEFLAALDPREIIRTRQGRGGPQAAEIARMLAETEQHIGAHREWLSAKRHALGSAHSALDAAFAELASLPAAHAQALRQPQPLSCSGPAC